MVDDTIEIGHPADALATRIERQGAPVCVGLDPVVDRLPSALRAGSDPVEAIARFCADVLRAVAPHVPAVKLQAACFERYRQRGVEVLFDLVALGRSLDMTVILDAKRGDIGISARHYAAAAFAGDGADWITANPYLGADGLVPFLEDGAAFALVRTSNEAGDRVQRLRVDAGGTVAEAVAALVAELGHASVGASGFSRLGAVVGATKPAEAGGLRAIMPEQIFLVPGFGAQGGGVDDVLPCFHADGRGALVTASRSIIYAFEAADPAWTSSVADAAAAMADTVGRAAGLRS